MKAPPPFMSIVENLVKELSLGPRETVGLLAFSELGSPSNWKLPGERAEIATTQLEAAMSLLSRVARKARGRNAAFYRREIQRVESRFTDPLTRARFQIELYEKLLGKQKRGRPQVLKSPFGPSGSLTGNAIGHGQGLFAATRKARTPKYTEDEALRFVTKINEVARSLGQGKRRVADTEAVARWFYEAASAKGIPVNTQAQKREYLREAHNLLKRGRKIERSKR